MTSLKTKKNYFIAYALIFSFLSLSHPLILIYSIPPFFSFSDFIDVFHYAPRVVWTEVYFLANFLGLGFIGILSLKEKAPKVLFYIIIFLVCLNSFYSGVGFGTFLHECENKTLFNYLIQLIDFGPIYLFVSLYLLNYFSKMKGIFKKKENELAS